VAALLLSGRRGGLNRTPPRHNSGASLEAFQGGFSPAIVKFVGTLRQSGARSSDRETHNQKAHGDVILAFSRAPNNNHVIRSHDHSAFIFLVFVGRIQREGQFDTVLIRNLM
jgi:hypothetical protein